MQYITFTVSLDEVDTWPVKPQCEPGGPWETDEGVTITFVYKLQLGAAQALAAIREILEPQRADWLRPVTVLTADWALDLDALKREFPKLLNPLGWLRGQVIITPKYEVQRLGGVPPQLADVIRDGHQPTFVTRVRFKVTASELVSAKHPYLMGKIGSPRVSGEASDRQLERPPLEEMSAGPLKLVPVNPNDLSPEAREWSRKEQLRLKYPGPISWKAPLGQYTVRFIWNRVYARPKEETFHQFIHYVLMVTLGKNWYDTQLKLPIEDQHIIMHWNAAVQKLIDSDSPPELKTGDRFELTPTSELQELLVLADDVYRLQLVRRIPRSLRQRLRSYDLFQGARYEIAVAAMFVRCGFEIEWIDEKAVKHCEFVARHKVSGEAIAVEAKSRVREGALHQKGPALDPSTPIPADVANLFEKALGQNPGDKPFAIFIDANLPHQPEKSALEKTWVEDIQQMLERRPEPSEAAPAGYTFLFVTNFAWHFGGRHPPAPGEFLFYAPTWSRQPLKELATLDALFYAVTNYGSIPEDD